MTGLTASEPGSGRVRDLYATMARIRAFEERVARHFRAGDIHGFVHVSIGQEAVAAGVCAALEPADYVTTTHRGHGHCLAKGADPTAMMAELFGRATGLCGGRGGSMHIADPSLGILGANGIVGAGIPLAAGAAIAARTRGDGRVAIAFFGEGAVHCGAFHEALVLAVAWTLPIVFVCESNGYAEFTAAGAWGGPSPAARGAGYGMPAITVAGTDPSVVHDALTEPLDRARRGEGPSFAEIHTHRLSGHYEGDAQPYRPEAELEESRRHDPLVLGRDAVGPEVADDLRRAADEEMERAVADALAAPYPEPESVLDAVYA